MTHRKPTTHLGRAFCKFYVVFWTEEADIQNWDRNITNDASYGKLGYWTFVFVTGGRFHMIFDFVRLISGNFLWLTGPLPVGTRVMLWRTEIWYTCRANLPWSMCRQWLSVTNWFRFLTHYFLYPGIRMIIGSLCNYEWHRSLPIGVDLREGQCKNGSVDAWLAITQLASKELKLERKFKR